MARGSDYCNSRHISATERLTALNYSAALGGPNGSLAVSPDPAAALIYLPLWFFKPPADNISLIANATTGYYMWNTTGPVHKRLVTSSAYMAFKISNDAGDATVIKIPFSLLDRELRPPLAEKPSRYFPIRGTYDNTFTLGRAFLQGAYMATNYDSNMAFLAQAPGPNWQGHGSLVDWSLDSTDMEHNQQDTFASTWNSTWTVLEKENGVAATSPPVSMLMIAMTVAILSY